MKTSRRQNAGSLPPFWQLVEAHGPELLAHARRLSGNDNAEDVLQEALLRALRSYAGLTHGNHLRAWLYRVTTTTAFDSHRRKERSEVPMAELPERATWDAGNEARQFQELIDGLSPAARETLMLRYMQDLDYEEIGRRLGCTPAAARQRVSGAVRTLRRRMT